MDSDSSDNSSSEYSSTDSSDDDGMETAEIQGVKLQIPQGLCERLDVFKEIMSTTTWNSLSERHRQYLQQFLPDFPENDLEEKDKTLQSLFACEPFRFNSNPLEHFHEQLKAGYFRPDIAKMRNLIKKSQHRESKYRYRMLRENLKREVIESQKKMMSQVRNLPPGVEPKAERNSGSEADRILQRTRKRYFQVLSAIRTKSEDLGFSSDENYPDGPPNHLSRKQKRHLNSLKNYVLNSDKVVVSTVSLKSNGVDLDDYVTGNHNPFYVTEDMYKNMVSQHKRRKLEHDSAPELNTRGITLSDIINRTQLPYLKNIPIVTNKHHIENKINTKKKFKKDTSSSNEPMLKTNMYLGQSSNTEDSDSDSFVDTVFANSHRVKHKSGSNSNKITKMPIKLHTPIKQIKTEVKKEQPPAEVVETPMSTSLTTNLIKPINSFSQYGKVAPMTLSELEGIDMMNLPIDLDNSDIDILEVNNKPELMQETHSNFLSLIRDIICSTSEHRMSLKALEDRLKSWQENPISPLNDWYNLQDNWLGLLTSAIDFLCGNFPDLPEDFVPYMEHKLSLDMYQWIGAGRDSDTLLLPLCQFWLEHRCDSKVDVKEEMDIEVSDRAQTPPPPRCPTTWTVRKASPEEIRDFQEQERRRYDNPHKAFTYRCNGYESVVGPLKGIYNSNIGNTKARGHTMLTADRPKFVTILSLVRDATARLPNGEGTRSEICELLKCSQYISSTAADSVLQTVVSGALDRMHTQFDPCVKYDQKRKIWIYLHRNRSEEDFERIHQQCQGMTKTSKKSTSKKTPTKTKPKVENVQSPQSSEKNKPLKTKVTPPVASPAPMASNISNTSNVTNKITVATKPTSLLLSSNVSNSSENPPQLNSPSEPLQPSPTRMSQEEKEINTALQAIVQNRVSSPISKQLLKGTKSLVKIISPSQGKSLIIPANSAQGVKQDKVRQTITQQNLNQQIIQTLASPQKQTIQIIQKPGEEKQATVEQKIKVPVTIQQQIIQSISPQHFQNIKNVTLLRSVSQNSSTNVPAIMTIAPNHDSKINVTETKTSVQQDQPIIQQNIQIKGPTSLTPAQQQQIFQTIKQKILPQATILTPQQQQIILKQKPAGTVAKQGQIAPGTSLLGQPKVADTSKATIPTSQTPVVAKVLTNAAGQVISVESLLAHQKQNTLAQGTTLRVAGGKGVSQGNVIQLTSSSSKPNTITQFAVASQNNLIALTTQPKLVVSSQTTTVTSTLTSTKPISRTVTKTQNQPITKFPTKVAQQLINAKIITQGLDGQTKLIMTQPNQVKLAATSKNVTMTKPVTLNVAAGGNTIRMVNAANLNLTHIGGKPVLLAGKGNSLQNIQGQNVILQTQPNTSTQQLVLQSAVKTTNSSGMNLINQSNVVLGTQVKVPPQVVFSSALKSTSGGVSQPTLSQSHIVLGGHPVRLQTTMAGGNTQRVVLASQGQGGQIVAQQILLPAGFQGTAINIKALQGVKVIPIAQAHGQARGIQGRQVFARVMSPSMVKTPTSTNTSSSSGGAGSSSSTGTASNTSGSSNSSDKPPSESANTTAE